jgi:uncharacterized protein YggU (UPF0235/DUF167 family)
MSDVRVRVTPRSSRTKVEVGDDGLQVWVTAAPTDGQANEAVCRLIAKALSVAPSRVFVVRGETSRHQTLRVEGLEWEEIRAKLAPP